MIIYKGSPDELKNFFSKNDDVQVKEIKFDSKQAMEDFLNSILKKGGN